MKRHRTTARAGLAAAALALAVVGGSSGQVTITPPGRGTPVPPFFGPGGPVAFNPEPAAVFSGHSVWTGATVTEDRKYVRLNMVPQQTTVTGVQTFNVYANGGFASADGAWGTGGNRAVPDPGIGGPARNPPPIVSASAPLQGVLAREGMTRLSGLD